MAWIDPSVVTQGEVLTSAKWNQDVVANTIALRVPPMVRAERASAQSIANNVNTVINFDTENFDTDGMFAATANLITINTAGIYAVQALMSFVNSSANGVRSCGVYLNPTFTGSGDSATINTADRRIAHAGATSVTTGADQTLACGTLFEFAAADTVALSCFQNSGGGINTDNYDFPALSLAWVGQVS